MRRAARIALALALATSACGGPRPAPPATPVERMNAEGVRRLDRGDVAGAETMFHDALREAEVVDDLPGEAEAWDNAGALAMARGDVASAVASHARAVALHAEHGAPTRASARARANLGAALLAAGNLEDARAAFDAAARDAAASGDPASVAATRAGLAAVRLRAGDAAGAERDADAASRLDGATDATRASALAVVGAARSLRGDVAGARAALGAALALDRQRGAPLGVVADLRALATLEDGAGRRAEAAALWARSSRAARRLGDLRGAGTDLDRAIAAARAAGADPGAYEAERAAIAAPPAR